MKKNIFEFQNISRRTLLKSAAIGGLGLTIGSGLYFKNRFSPLPKMYSERKKLMGTWIAITVFHKSEDIARKAIQAGFQEMQMVDSLMSIHKEDSQISMVNKFAGEKEVSVDSRVMEVLQIAQNYALASQGTYDITILPLMKLFGFYGNKPTHIPSDKIIAQTLEAINWKGITLSGNSVALQQKGAGIDLGSVGKGYAVDRAVLALKQHGITSALVDAGGNLFALGAPYEDADPRLGWRVAIRDPKNEKDYLDIVEIRDKGIATSGRDQNFVNIDSQEIGHIFNAVTGKEAKGYLCSTAISKTATDADVLSTTSYILGPDKSKALFSNSEFKFFS